MLYLATVRSTFLCDDHLIIFIRQAHFSINVPNGRNPQFVSEKTTYYYRMLLYW